MKGNLKRKLKKEFKKELKKELNKDDAGTCDRSRRGHVTEPCIKQMFFFATPMYNVSAAVYTCNVRRHEATQQTDINPLSVNHGAIAWHLM